MFTEITFVLCEACLDFVLETESECHDDMSYCQRCIEEVRS